MKRRAVSDLVLAAAIAVAGAIPLLVASCSVPPDFVPFTCALQTDGTAFDAGADGAWSDDGDDAAPGTDGGLDAASDASTVTPYALARQIGPADCALASIVWVQCALGIDARYRAVYAADGGNGELTVDYYLPANGSLVGEVVYVDNSANGVCTLGPAAFIPPACAGPQLVCCAVAVSTDGGDAGSNVVPDASGEGGCGF